MDKRRYWIQIDPETGNPEGGIVWAYYPDDKPTAGTWILLEEV